jgi:hypothetical protein
VVPFNQGSRQDIQRLVNWLVSTEKTTVGGTQRTVKEPWLVDLLVPFGAVGEEATLAELSDRSMATLRVLLYGVEALVSECARAFSRLHVRETRTHVLLPLSPNHGQFGNDGLYGEAKAALEAMLNRWGSEQAAWGRHTSLVGARIGWVRGTGLMNVNNAIAPGLEPARACAPSPPRRWACCSARAAPIAVRALPPRRPSWPTSPAAWTRCATSRAWPARLRAELTAASPARSAAHRSAGKRPRPSAAPDGGRAAGRPRPASTLLRLPAAAFADAPRGLEACVTSTSRASR